KIIQYAKKLEHLATIDTLTQLQNRRGMMNHLRKLADSYSSTNYPFSLVISDIDLFKKVNDTYGHDTGDYVLANLAVILKDFMRDKGRVARWGGEEFLFVFEGKNGDYVFEELNKLKFLIEKSIFTYKDYSFSITMTFGLEEFDSNTGIEKTIEKADEKLYQGKEHGRNCVVY
ncbi:MAG TPA: GGDEF domain-containing protein, partial [Lachnospiraceae bacterium]|nr:GGDEF domain-containing protein [Lachnospiraceae bacterium]